METTKDTNNDASVSYLVVSQLLVILWMLEVVCALRRKLLQKLVK